MSVGAFRSGNKISTREAIITIVLIPICTALFRINRKYIISAMAIQDMVSYTNSRLKLVLRGSDDSDIIVSRERVQEFKDWLDR